ncbi:MAG: hypothetical protein HOH86_12975 [Verrucomicrobiales bacterium]|nr:hypothetical protein [Verrucomicrobiales bacterium]
MRHMAGDLPGSKKGDRKMLRQGRYFLDEVNVVLAMVLVFSGCLGAIPGTPVCPAGQVSTNGACLGLCASDAQCTSDQTCGSDGVCGLSGLKITQEALPVIDMVDGTGLPDLNPEHSNHHITDELVIFGENLSGADVLFGPTGLEEPLTVLASAFNQITVLMPDSLTGEPGATGAYEYSLRVVNAAGETEVRTFLLQGEPGVKGDIGGQGAPGTKGDIGEQGAPGVGGGSISAETILAALGPSAPRAVSLRLDADTLRGATTQDIENSIKGNLALDAVNGRVAVGGGAEASGAKLSVKPDGTDRSAVDGEVYFASPLSDTEQSFRLRCVAGQTCEFINIDVLRGGDVLVVGGAEQVTVVDVHDPCDIGDDGACIQIEQDISSSLIAFAQYAVELVNVDILSLYSASGQEVVKVNGRGDLITSGHIEADNVGRITYRNNTSNTSVPIDESVVIRYCGDIDGCQVRIGMFNWDTSRRSTSRSYLFYYDAQTRNWRASNDAWGTAGAGNTQHALHVWSCYFTDGQYANGTDLGDTNNNMNLLNWNEYVNETCFITLID